MADKHPTFDFKKIEAAWAKQWEEAGIYAAPQRVSRDTKYYVLPQFPYPSGSGLHVGHAEGYAACDVFARFKRMQGKEVLQAIGWDAFGLPAENYAIKTNIHPRITINNAIDNFRYQIKRMGISVDWNREIGTHTPEYYHWTQWLFLLMFKMGLAYQKKQAVNWCESCKTVLANEQVVDGVCERCGTEVVQKEMKQWFLKITKYANRLYKDLDKVDWPQESIKRQREWIGKSRGAEIAFQIHNTTTTIKVFTTRPDTIYGATFLVLAPEHAAVKKLKSHITNSKAVQDYITDTSFKTELERQQQEKQKTGVQLEGVYAINPANKKKIPVFIADYVLMSYGTGSVMAVPAHDTRDFEFAKKHGLDIVPVIKDPDGTQDTAYTGSGVLIHSPLFKGLSYPDDAAKILRILKEQGIARAKTIFKLRDWSVSRQRFWGAPIPIMFDPEGTPHPAQESDLPIKLPDDVDFRPTGQSPLVYSDDFQKGVERMYGAGWRRETDTLDTFMCSSWYYFRYLDPHNDKAFASPEALKSWMPVDFYIGGPEHVTGHLLYSRFITKALYDAGYITFDEPFLVHRHQGLILGEDRRKMSKRWGNVINPTDVMDRHGADVLRLYELFMGPLEETKSWNTRDEAGVFRFINKVWNLQTKVKDVSPPEEQERWIHKVADRVSRDIKRLSFNTAIAFCMEFVNFLQKEDVIARSVWERFLRVLAPFTPFATEELWHRLGNKFSIHQQVWPEIDPAYLKEEIINIAVQVNGKTRGLVTGSPDISEKEVIAQAKENETIAKYIKDGYKKTIFVPGKILNFIV